MKWIEEKKQIEYVEELIATHSLEVAESLVKQEIPYVLVVESMEDLSKTWGYKYVFVDDGSVNDTDKADYFDWVYARQLRLGYKLVSDSQISICEVAANDRDRLYEMYEDVLASKYLEKIPYLEGDEWLKYVDNQYSQMDMRGYAMWIVKLMDGSIIGRAGFQETDDGKVSLGYMIAKEYRGKGYGYVAAKLCMKYAIENLEGIKIISEVDSTNVASISILSKLTKDYPALEVKYI